MSRSWQALAVIGLFGLVACGPAGETGDVVQGGEGVTVEAGPGPAEGTPADGVPAELPPEIDVIPTNE